MKNEREAAREKATDPNEDPKLTLIAELMNRGFDNDEDLNGLLHEAWDAGHTAADKEAWVPINGPEDYPPPGFLVLLVSNRAGDRLIYEVETWGENVARYADKHWNDYIAYMPIKPYTKDTTGAADDRS